MKPIISKDETPKRAQTIESILVLHDIRSTHNVGSLFRTADSVGVSQIILSGTSPAPIDRFGRKRTDITKSSLGAEETVPWKQVDTILETLKELKSAGYTLIAIEQADNSIDYKEISLQSGSKVVIIPGYEVSGVPQEILELVDHIVEIPMYGTKESLNVSVATGIVLYRLLDR
jgi:23S rRNA (guanosine2251-2'-O)-methyltransferase